MKRYEVQEHLKPKALARISDAQIEEHWKLYEAYVKNTNELLDQIADAEAGSLAWAEMKRRLGFEFDGMVLHEYYFGNLAAGAALSPQSELASALTQAWKTLPAWREDFAATAAMRGIGWVILYHDPAIDRLFTWWVGEHQIDHPAGLNPILVLDVWEHAWMVDYGAGDKARYVEAFLDNVAWSVVEQRFKSSRVGERSARF